MSSHRASSSDRRAARSTPAPAGGAVTGGTHAGKRRAERRGGVLRTMSAMPTVVGVAALAVAGTGAAVVGHGGGLDESPITLSAGSSVVRHAASGQAEGSDAGLIGDIKGADAVFFGGNARAQAISRDSERQAAQDAAQQKLQSEAEAQNVQRNAALSSLAKAAQKRAGEIAKNQWVLPTVGYHLTARFGWSSGLWANRHTGLDFAAPTGTPIFAVADGVITDTGYDGSYGNKTVETLPDGTEIWYAHQSVIKVHVGEQVTQSETIGLIGSTGNTTGPHVHIEVRPGGGDPVDPYPAFVAHGVTP